MEAYPTEKEIRNPSVSLKKKIAPLDYPQPHLVTESIKKLDVANKFPLMLILDITNICNLQCPHCPQPQMAASPHYRPQMLDFKAYTKIVDEIANEDVKFLRFTGDGEPLLHRKFLDMISYAKNKTRIPLVVTTNGSLLTPSMSEQLLDFGMDVIDISLDAHTREKYAIVRKGGNYHQVMSHLHHLLFLRAKKKSKTKIMVNMINQKIVADEVDDFRKYWEPLVDFVLIRNLHSATKRVNLAEVFGKMEETQPRRHACAHLWKRLTINYSLDVKFCAHDWFDETVLSQLTDGGIRAIWFGERLKKIREAHLDNNYQSAQVCSNCPDWAAAPWDYGYEDILRKIGVIEMPFPKGSLRLRAPILK